MIQIAFGWKNSHLFEFNIDSKYRITFKDADFEDDNIKSVDARDVIIGDIYKQEKDEYLYEYDLGDSWEHCIKIEKFLKKQEGMKYPICSDGALNCPPEDCGGIRGFYELLKVLKDKNHPEYREMKDWAGRYDPLKFDIEAVNRGLLKYKSWRRKHWEV